MSDEQKCKCLSLPAKIEGATAIEQEINDENERLKNITKLLAHRYSEEEFKLIKAMSEQRIQILQEVLVHINSTPQCPPK